MTACRQLMAEFNLTILTLLHTYIYMLILCTTFEVLSVCVRILHSPLHHLYIDSTTMCAVWYTTVSFMTGNGPIGLFAIFHVYIYSSHTVVEFHWSAITMWLYIRTYLLRTYVTHWMLCSSQTIAKSSTGWVLALVCCGYFFSARTTQPHQPHTMHWSTVVEVKQGVWMSAQNQETMMNVVIAFVVCSYMAAALWHHSSMEGLVHDSMPEGPCVPILGCLCFLLAVEMRKTSSTSSFSVGSPVSLTSDSALSAAVRVCM